MSVKDIEKIFRTSPMDKSRVRFRGSPREAFVEDMKPTILTYGKSDMDKYLMNSESIDLIHSYGLELPSYYKDKSFEELKEALIKSQEISSEIEDKLKNVAEYRYDKEKRCRFAYPKSKEPKPNTKELIIKHNIMEIYKYNINQLRDFKEKTGRGILHFNNPLQLIDRLELLSGSILAGNNGVIQEFSQIAHLLN